jgi:hypothetical protein
VDGSLHEHAVHSKRISSFKLKDEVLYSKNGVEVTVADSIAEKAKKLREFKTSIDSGYAAYLGGALILPKIPETNKTKFYDILGIGINAEVKAIKKAYKKLALLHHPDKGNDGRHFKEVNAGEYCT